MSTRDDRDLLALFNAAAALDAVSAEGLEIGAYRVVREIGSGGMGVV